MDLSRLSWFRECEEMMGFSRNDACMSELLVLFDNTIIYITTALHVGDLAGKQVESKSGLKITPSSLFTNFDLARASSRETETTRDKFMSSVLERTDASE